MVDEDRTIQVTWRRPAGAVDPDDRQGLELRRAVAWANQNLTPFNLTVILVEEVSEVPAVLVDGEDVTLTAERGCAGCGTSGEREDGPEAPREGNLVEHAAVVRAIVIRAAHLQSVGCHSTHRG